MKILHVDASISGEISISSRLSLAVVNKLLALHPEAQIVRRDLVAVPLPYFDAQTLAALGMEQRPQPGSVTTQAQLQSEVLAEFMDADIVVVGAPMYNFGIPAQLKSWVDYISIAGVTFRYTPTGPEGLAGGRRIILASSRGGIYAEGTPAAAVEHQESYLKAVFGFLGITQLEVVRAEGVKGGREAAERALTSADVQIAVLEP